jgi:UDP-N-acetylglucosamine 2-epimerase (non-hydrolysing)
MKAIASTSSPAQAQFHEDRTHHPRASREAECGWEGASALPPGTHGPAQELCGPRAHLFVGNTMIETLLANMGRLQQPALWNESGLQKGEYFAMTLHRPANVDKVDGFARLLRAIAEGTRGLPVVFPVHPLTAKTLHDLNEVPSSFRLVDPQPYLEFNYLVRQAKAVITDSGGVTEETTARGMPDMTLRDSTELPETVTIDANELISTNSTALAPALDKLFAGEWKEGAFPEKWDGHIGELIVEGLERLLAASEVGPLKF